MTAGGPADRTLTYVLYLWYNAFQDFRMGYASALAWILFLIIMTLTMLQLGLSRRWVYYEGSATDNGV
jgi:multiple sugar transport system permease protein